MKKIILIYLTIAAQVFFITSQTSDQYCKVIQDSFEGSEEFSLLCSMFTDFSQLNLTGFQDSNITFTSLKFIPSNPLFFNNSLNLDGLTVDQTYVVTLQMINKFEILSNPFAILDYRKRVSLFLVNSVFDYLFDGNVVNLTLCNYLLKNEIDVTLLDTADFFTLDNPTFSKSPFCPFLFKAAKLIDFEVSKISQDNSFIFIDNSLLDLTDFTCQIDNFIIKDSSLVLDENLLNKQVFKEITSLSILNSVLNDVQNDIFKSFLKMKAADFELLNFAKFIQINSNNDWMKYINSNVTVNLTDENDIKKNLGNLFELTLTDYGNTYDFPQTDFCLFKNFPHEKLVMPIIRTKPNLSCSCTLMYLIQYKKIYEVNGVNPMQTESTENCLNSVNFDKILSECQFKEKLTECSGIPATTKSPKKDNDGFQTATIVLSITSALFLLLLVFIIYWFKFRKNESFNGSMSFSTFAADKKIIISS